MMRPVTSLRALLACATFCVPMFLAGQSRADDLADEADLQFTLGAERYQAGDFRGALQHFLASNRLVPNKNVLYNIARAYEQLKQFPDAFRYYTQALEQETEADARQRIETALTRIGANVAVLDIQTDPPGATIFIDRKDLGPRGSAPRKLGLPAGKYKVLVEAPGYEPASSESVEVRSGASAPVRLTLKRILGTIQLQGEPQGAEVRVGDASTGPACKLPCALELPPGRHTLHVTHPRYQAFMQEVDVAPRATTTVRPRLNALRGGLVVNTDERDALVEVDGHPMGFTPAVLNVQAGPRKVRISMPGFRPIDRLINIEPNKEARLELELRRLEEVTAASRAIESVEDAPSSVSIVPSQELRAMSYPTIVEALRGVRGVYVSDDRAYPTVGFRGFSRPGDYGNRVLVLLDGHPTNDNWIGSSYVGFDARTDLEDIERIEVVRGPGSVLYGTGAFSGVINLVSRKGLPTGGEVGVSTVEYGVSRGRARVNLKLADDAGLWMSVAGAKALGRDYYFPEFAEEGGWSRGRDGFKAGTLQGRLWWKSLSMQWFLHSRDKQLPQGAYDTLFADPRTRMIDTRGFVEALFEPKLSDSVQLMTRAHVNMYTFRGVYPYTFAPADGEEGLGRERYKGAWAGGEGRVVISPSSTVRLTVGGEGQHHFQVKQEGSNEVTSYLSDSRPYQVAAGYILADVVPSDAVRLSGGARLDWYSTFGSSINPRAAVIVRPYEQGTVKLLAGKAFRAPSVYELYYNDGGRTQVASASVTELRPETIWSPELEFSHRFSTTWTGLVSGYANHIKDLIVSRGEGLPASPFYYENSNSPVLTTGAEAELRREWRQGWMVAATYAFQRSRYTESAEPDGTALRKVPNSPEQLASLKGAVPVIPRVLTASTRFSIEGPRYDAYDRGTDPAQGRTDPAVIWDVVVSGEAARGLLRYSAGVYNAFNWRYTLPISTDFRQRVMLQSGRTFLASVSTHF